MTTEINLEMFCSSNRPELARPFSIDAWTYASDGHILVRVPRRDDVAENPDAPNASLVYEKVKSPRRYKPAPKFELPEAFEEKVQCYRCRGKGTAHECPDCQCKCHTCGGTGQFIEPAAPIKIGRTPFAPKYISWMQSLPDLEIGPPHKRTPLAFRFHGGEGRLAPLEW
jgi:hypothetical protein